MKILATVLMYLLLAISAEAADRYASPSGSGSACTDIKTPCTLTTALGQLATTETLYLRAGTYNQGFSIGSIPSGNAGTQTTISAYNNETVILQPPNGVNGFNQVNSYITLHGLILDGTNAGGNQSGVECEAAYNCHHLIFEDGQVRNFSGIGFHLSGDGYNIIRRSTIHDNASNNTDGPPHGFYIGGAYNLFEDLEIYNHGFYGLQIYNGTHPDWVHDNIVRRVKAHHNAYYNVTPITPSGNSSAGIMIAGPNSEVSNSISYSNGVSGQGDGIQVSPYGSDGCAGCKIYNNTVWGNVAAGLASYSGSGAEWRNNISYNNGTADNLAGDTADHNLCTSPGAGCLLSGDPRFTNTSSGDFTLLSNSIAINQGVDASAALGCTAGSTCTDYAGNIRPYPPGGAWDIGAFEYGAGAPTPPTPALVLAMAFETGLGTTSNDLSGFNNNGTFGTGVSWDNSGKYGKALSFNGTGGLRIQDSSSLNFTTYTLEAWVYPTTAPATFAPVINKYSYPNGDGSYFLEYKSDPVVGCPFAYATAGHSAAVSAYVCDTTDISLNQWTHLAATYDGITLAFYRDGQVRSTNNPAIMTPMNGGYLDIGYSIFGEYFTGKIDEVRIYNYARTPAQIVSDMNTPLVAAPGAVAGITFSADKSITLCASCSITVQAQ